MRKISSLIWGLSALTLSTLTLTACGGGGSDSSPTPTTQPQADILHTLSGSPTTSLNEDQDYRFQVTVSNPDNDPLTFAMVNAPDWLSISNQGLVTGRANTDADTGSFADIVITASDDKQNDVSLDAFTLVVSAVDDPAVITFANEQYGIDGRSSADISFTIEDEDSTPALNISGVDASITTNMLSNTIEVTVPDITAVIDNTLTITAGTNGGSASVPVKFYPVNESGLGRTIKGKREGPGVHLLILGDGYQDSELDLYEQDALDFIGILDSDPFIAQHLAAWSVHVVNVASTQSGADTNFGTDDVDTAFGSGYNCADIQRLICANTFEAFNVASIEYPWVDEIILVVNSEQYGGSGGAIAIYNRTSPEIALHEMGHSFASLADEYVDSNLAESRAATYTQGQYANVSNSTDASEAPWAHWIEDINDYPTTAGDEGVGLFEGSYYNATGFYRPLTNSRMMSNSANFGVVNAEQWIYSSYISAGGAYESFSPSALNLQLDAPQTQSFSVTPMFGIPTQNIVWTLNGNVLTAFNNQASIELALESGTQTLSVDITDATNTVRATNRSFATEANIEWTIEVN